MSRGACAHQAREAVPGSGYDRGAQGQQEEGDVDVALRTRVVQGRISPLQKRVIGSVGRLHISKQRYYIHTRGIKANSENRLQASKQSFNVL